MEATLIDHMGSDLTVVNAARVSFDKHHEVFDVSDERLIHYLASNGHWTPFSHPMVTLRETIPIFMARQRIRHTVGFTYNEVSRRYVADTPEIFDPEYWREYSPNKKQGSGDKILEASRVGLCFEAFDKAVEQALTSYETLLDAGVCPEQARIVLPLATYTSWYVTGSLAAWARAYKLRTHEHAQEEIRTLAKQWDNIIRPLFPHSWSALVD